MHVMFDINSAPSCSLTALMSNRAAHLFINWGGKNTHHESLKESAQSTAAASANTFLNLPW